MIPVWFDKAYFGQQKVEQMNALNYEPSWLEARGETEWNMALYQEYLAAYRSPDGKSVSAWENFLACNGSGYAPGIDAAQINISCNPLFDPDYYAQSLANWANDSGYAQEAEAGRAADVWTPATITSHVLHDLGLSLWEHFKTAGLREQLNPSADFDTHAYLEARARAMSNAGDAFSIAAAIDAMLVAGLNPVMDFEEYGKAHAIQAQPVLASAPARPVVPPVSSGGSASGATSLPATPPAATKPDEPADPENPDEAPANQDKPDTNPEQPGITYPEAPDTNPDGPEAEDPGADPDPEEPGSDSPFDIHIVQEGNVTIPPLASEGEDISVYVDATGLVNVASLDALGSGGKNGIVSLTIPNGNLGDGNLQTVIRGQNIDIDLGGAHMPEEQAVFGYPRVEIWANGVIDATGCNDYDWFSIRDLGPGRSEINLDDGKDIFELFDMSATCSPANLLADVDLNINLGSCWDQLYIGDLAVQGGGIQTIHIDLGDDFNYETISLGRVTAGKLILSMEHCSPYDEITTRRKIAPATFADGDNACEALEAFGISAGEAELGVWHDRVRSNGLTEKAYANAAIYADNNTYVIYGNVLLELQGIGQEDYASA